MRVVSPMPEGSGAIAVHRQLAEALPGYQVMPYSPRREYWPFGLHRLVGRSAELVHTAPDYAIFSAPADVPLMLTFHNYILDADMRRYSSLMQRIHYRTSLRHFTRRALVR
ncbi:MAG TPA: glycosyltransferase family 1 protein, partial [Gammaproteobacteria bacterium]|nr:glycosyltransferase family 1 protein [Gammaproteobacteria bacterium]